MAQIPVATRYAQAFFELAREKGEINPLGTALQETSALFGASAELRTVLSNPAVQLAERRKVVEAIGEKAKWPRLFRNFLMLLLDKDRLRYLGEIAASFQEKVDAHEGRVRARVTSATSLSDGQVEKIKAQLASMTGKEVMLTTEVDADLIGGVVARVGSKIYDGSVRTHLERMREAILKEV